MNPICVYFVDKKNLVEAEQQRKHLWLRHYWPTAHQMLPSNKWSNLYGEVVWLWKFALNISRSSVLKQKLIIHVLRYHILTW